MGDIPEKTKREMETKIKHNKKLQKELQQIDLSRVSTDEYDSQIKEMEKLVSCKMQKVIFDSNRDNWSIGSSTFDLIVKGREKVAFFIEDTNKNIFGAFVSNKIEGYAKKQSLNGATSETAHMFIINPFKAQQAEFSSLLSTHPSTEERIKRLNALAKELAKDF